MFPAMYTASIALDNPVTKGFCGTKAQANAQLVETLEQLYQMKKRHI